MAVVSSVTILPARPADWEDPTFANGDPKCIDCRGWSGFAKVCVDETHRPLTGYTCQAAECIGGTRTRHGCGSCCECYCGSPFESDFYDPYDY